MIKNLVTHIIILWSIQIFAQTKTDIKHYDKQFEYAKELIDMGDYKSAYTNLMELYLIDSTDVAVNYYLAFASFYANRDKTIAIPYFEKGKTFNGNAYYFLGVIYHQLEQFEKAQESFNSYKSISPEEKLFSTIEVSQQIEKIEVARELMKNKKNLVVENLGPNINSPYPDYAPILFANGNRLYYTSRKPGSFPEYKDPNNEYFEDVYYSEKVNNAWENSVNVGLPINSKTHDASVAISQDENTLYIYRTNTSLIGGDILKSTKIDGKWTEPTLFESTLNTKTGTESSISIHPNGHQIFFSSNRLGGYGGKDIYFIIKLPNGAWSLPTNAGGMINTELDEDGPFMASDSTTLYFSSKGHKNMGGYDLFSTRLQDNGLWSEPENLGMPINSVKDDIFISTLNNEDYFFSSNRAGGLGFSDIYHTVLPKEKNEHLIVKGRILDENQVSLRANITLFNKGTNQLEGIYKSDSQTGKFVMILQPGEQYKLFVEVKGYYNYTEQIDLSKSLSLNDVLKTIRMTKKVEEEVY